jgi:cytochrome c oxidase subunit 2
MYEEFIECDLTVKVSGFQWYWSYEIKNINTIFESIIKNRRFKFRLIETFNHLILPIKCMIRFLVSSNDVIHSWTIPSIGIKIDATPGRISQIISIFQRPGLYIGQCREICGSNHSFIPITVSVNSLNNYL